MIISVELNDEKMLVKTEINYNEKISSNPYSIFRYCEHCNTDMYLKADTDEQYDILNNITVCPVCGKAISTKPGHRLLLEIGFSDGEFPITSENQKELPQNFDELEVGAPLKYKGYTVYKARKGFLREHDGTLKSVLSFFKSYRDDDFINKANQKFEELIDCFEMTEVSEKVQSKKIKTDFETLKEFISNAVKVESNFFSVSEHLKNLYCSQEEMKLDAFASVKILQLKEKSEVDILQHEYDTLINSSSKMVVSSNDVPLTYPVSPIKPNKGNYPRKPLEPTLKKGNIFNKKIIAAENEELIHIYQIECDKYTEQCETIDKKFAEEMKKYESEYREYEQAVMEFEKQRQEIYDERKKSIKEKLDIAIARYNYYDEECETIVTPERAKLEFINNEIKKAEELLKKLYAVRNEIYGCGVIFVKYCNFVAISSFYEYLSSGRCQQLEGHDGAYNIYENEIRLDMVVSQLSQVIQSLEQIQRNQYVIYSAIKETNKQINALNGTMKKAVESIDAIKSDVSDMKECMKDISENTAVAAYYSQVSAYYSKKTAELADALGFMVALK